MTTHDEAAPPTTTTEPQQSWDQTVARILTEAFSPAVLVVVCLSLIAAHTAPSRLQAIIWATLAALLCSIAPMTYILRGVRHGHWSNHHVHERHQRRGPLIVCLLGCTAAIIAGLFGGAPRDLIAVIVSAATVLLAAYVCTTVLRFKISIHSIVAFGTMTVLAIVISPLVLTAAPLPLAIGWSRIHLREHTTAQVIAGALLGIINGVAVLSLLR
jgi:membrane-associated phospholipid phosphatase